MGTCSRPVATLEPKRWKTTAPPFAEKMEGLTRELATQFHESEKLQAAIRDNMIGGIAA